VALTPNHFLGATEKWLPTARLSVFCFFINAMLINRTSQDIQAVNNLSKQGDVMISFLNFFKKVFNWIKSLNNFIGYFFNFIC